MQVLSKFYRSPLHVLSGFTWFKALHYRMLGRWAQSSGWGEGPPFREDMGDFLRVDPSGLKRHYLPMSMLSQKGYDVLVNVTDVCDARCVMCNIWKNPETSESFLPAELLRGVKPLASVSFAGGEPFLHRNITDIVETVHEENPDCKIVFSSNGFETGEIVNQVRKVMKIHDHVQVTISLDGVGREHDRIRGIPGAWTKVNKTFDELGKAGLKNRNFAFTITAHNHESLPGVFEHARKKGAGLSLAVAQSSKFLNIELPRLDPDLVRPHLQPLVEWHLKSMNPMNWARAFFFAGILYYLMTGERPIRCDALDGQFMIDQQGQVFTCHPLLWSVGTLSEKKLPEILSGEPAYRLRPEIHACEACWEVCTARSSIRKNLGRVGLWMAWNKILAHLGAWDGKNPMRGFPVERVKGNA